MVTIHVTYVSWGALKKADLQACFSTARFVDPCVLSVLGGYLRVLTTSQLNYPAAYRMASVPVFPMALHLPCFRPIPDLGLG